MTRRPRPGETLGEFPPITGESVRSRNYEAGRAVRYAGRIHGPTFPVTSYTVDDLPDDSVLKPIAQAMYDFAHDPINSAEMDGKMAAWFAAAGIAHSGSAPTRDDLYDTLHSDSHLGHGKASE